MGSTMTAMAKQTKLVFSGPRALEVFCQFSRCAHRWGLSWGKICANFYRIAVENGSSEISPADKKIAEDRISASFSVL